MNENVHLTREQLASLWDASGGQWTGDAGAARAETEHVRSCALCRREWELLGAAAQDLNPLTAMHNENATAGCPAPERLRAVAAGELTGADADALLDHTTACDHCGAVLRMAIENFQDELSAEEQHAIAAMRSAQPDWQHQMAVRLSATGLSSAPSQEETPQAAPRPASTESTRAATMPPRADSELFRN